MEIKLFVFRMFKMVFVINGSLRMSTGKLASQVAHSAVSLYISAKSNPKKHVLFFDEIDVWVRTGQKKVVLKGAHEQHLISLEKEAKEHSLLTVLIRDAGRTEIQSGSMTCLGIFGAVEQIDSVTGSLSLYS